MWVVFLLERHNSGIINSGRPSLGHTMESDPSHGSRELTSGSVALMLTCPHSGPCSNWNKLQSHFGECRRIALQVRGIFRTLLARVFIKGYRVDSEMHTFRSWACDWRKWMYGWVDGCLWREGMTEVEWVFCYFHVSILVLSKKSEHDLGWIVWIFMKALLCYGKAGSP